MLLYLLIFIIAYLMGSFPTAYLLLKYRHGKDITKEGSGNVGALNSFEVTKSRMTGITVLLIDFAKGFLAVFLSRFIGDDLFIAGAIALNAAVLGHCFSPWLIFKGGRGLATAAGGAVLLAPAIFLVWSLIWVIAFLFRRNVHFGNISATFLTALLTYNSGEILNKYSFPPAESETEFIFAVITLMIIILSKHLDPLKEWLKISQKSTSRE